MSKLGNVYELDFNTRMKNKYPIVAEEVLSKNE